MLHKYKTENAENVTTYQFNSFFSMHHYGVKQIRTLGIDLP